MRNFRLTICNFVPIRPTFNLASKELHPKKEIIDGAFKTIAIYVQ